MFHLIDWRLSLGNFARFQTVRFRMEINLCFAFLLACLLLACKVTGPLENVTTTVVLLLCYMP